ncbi:MAG: 4-alpha-glucanotransferase, partial [Deinococcales bacterium]|nr:4-alpha-glucanotransferase [Chitinophagaceae bacterium]
MTNKKKKSAVIVLPDNIISKNLLDVNENDQTNIAQYEFGIIANEASVVEKPLNFYKKSITVSAITFQLRYNTQFGQSLYIIGNHNLLGNNNFDNAIPLQYLNENTWTCNFNIESVASINTPITYNYLLKNADGSFVEDWGNDKTFNPAKFITDKVIIIDTWNHAGYIDNAFYTVPFQNVLLKANHTSVTLKNSKTVTHIFRVKAPLLAKGQTLCLVGDNAILGKWQNNKAIVMAKEENAFYYEVAMDMSITETTIAYKYGVYSIDEKTCLYVENGSNRFLEIATAPNQQTVVNDGFAVLTNNQWKGAGVAIPVFSLRSQNSFGVGEFTDMTLLVDWAKQIGLKLIQILPINDTTATRKWLDSYPYAAISAFALHPIYVNVGQIADDVNQPILATYLQQQQALNSFPDVDYEAVMAAKMAIISQLYPLQKQATFKSEAYKIFFNQNKHWLVPYAAFCFFRDQYGSPVFTEWPQNNQYNSTAIEALTNEASASYDAIAISYFIQFHLHQQLKAATQYAHKNGVVVKGDIAIGIYRDSVDAWQQPELFHMHLQAGAPPDDFAVKGQNWGFPTYNWQRMKEDGFAWWKQRFEQMSHYFDAFRIDHILGFFRIWSIPLHAVEGIMGYFVPAFPVHINEFNEKDIWFNYQRYTQPFINEYVLWELFGYDNDHIKDNFLDATGNDNYILKSAFNTQRKVAEYFAQQESSHFNDVIKQHLFDLISNVILFEVAGSNGTQFHFRFSMANTISFKSLEWGTQQKLNNLYINYFFRRQDAFWKEEALQKLPALKRTTNMLICGEDLGLVPDCVADVMKQLGLLTLEIQRMPKDPKTEFFHPNDAPYLSVVTPSTHDMSTIRGWWEEDKPRIQKFFNNQLGQWGLAPTFCSGWINKTIINQHLYSPAMWSIFQLQDLLGMDESIRRQNHNEERINVP